ncbi:bifunctional 2-polyprenyl-6-hydroxyphenol methylase/3-demethylubiquinol 3-O-methyltransferase UbiG [Burkholderia cenocepacia]|uniref:Ubiquinone biosynthesis O-methyltransferase n=1 Tax=Burkholderia cenocepacia TaxID=95486 RepID=A0ABD4U5A2_9BURK|nr:bifunctional 2-polyprenyl-6-hydroxyphenol methylase/3-demethylubiquinol 3-O-methyltransferase UbiG [Burkholderia cenocepacia]MCW3604742.1 bifunctional 2-polyprenyl-6-hydroxyphenol methylase/3-demethylubiquinol 3-O-methyltransferase UbiG [Burkholderia cenocepacia]MCW3694243.1 bifunctional 2-polyprenyl-6-hydroxyphenol methylase/3-demethylubiquinol 3-O-methyltransferase UbiG [Burkholderia cenocepacia]MCW3702530.1 bifunctional 2-polyprenyl-6-hydroxyphenol methylase/3-demethylubiquinol 3-O-methylt
MLNADPHEIRKFNDLAHRWWEPDAEFKPLHDLNPVRLGWIDAHADLAGKRALDVGCGGGILAESMARIGAQVKGIDLSADVLAAAALHGRENGIDIDYEAIGAEALATREPGAYDVVTCMEMLEHVPSPAAVVAACSTLVKPGGWVFFSTLDRNPKSYLLAVVGAEYVARIVPKGTHDYARFIRPDELASFARSTSLRVVDTRGIVYNPLTRRARLTHDTSVNYVVACRRRA